MDNITSTSNLELQLLNSLVQEKVLSLLKDKLDSKLPELVVELSELIDEFKRLCKDYLGGNSKKVGKVSFKEVAKVVKVVKRLQQKFYKTVIVKNEALLLVSIFKFVRKLLFNFIN